MQCGRHRGQQCLQALGSLLHLHLLQEVELLIIESQGCGGERKDVLKWNINKKHLNNTHFVACFTSLLQKYISIFPWCPSMNLINNNNNNILLAALSLSRCCQDSLSLLTSVAALLGARSTAAASFLTCCHCRLSCPPLTTLSNSWFTTGTIALRESRTYTHTQTEGISNKKLSRLQNKSI